MLALVIRYTVSVVYYEPYIYGSNPETPVWFRQKNHEYLCKIVLIFMMYGYVAPIFWMFIEGVYLHSRVATNVLDSRTPFKFYYCVGWCKSCTTHRSPYRYPSYRYPSYIVKRGSNFKLLISVMISASYARLSDQ